ncbi:hypothetical protein [Streptomyces prunicolor]
MLKGDTAGHKAGEVDEAQIQVPQFAQAGNGLPGLFGEWGVQVQPELAQLREISQYVQTADLVGEEEVRELGEFAQWAQVRDSGEIAQHQPFKR